MLSNPYSNVYEIDLPSGIKARWFLNASRLIKARNNPIFGQLLKFKDSVNINIWHSEELVQVERM
jgi:hypothetical protein